MGDISYIDIGVATSDNFIEHGQNVIILFQFGRIGCGSYRLLRGRNNPKRLVRIFGYDIASQQCHVVAIHCVRPQVKATYTVPEARLSEVSPIYHATCHDHQELESVQSIRY